MQTILKTSAMYLRTVLQSKHLIFLQMMKYFLEFWIEILSISYSFYKFVG